MGWSDMVLQPGRVAPALPSSDRAVYAVPNLRLAPTVQFSR